VKLAPPVIWSFLSSRSLIYFALSTEIYGNT
jgi:hypothetical protein